MKVEIRDIGDVKPYENKPSDNAIATEQTVLQGATPRASRTDISPQSPNVGALWPTLPIIGAGRRK